MPRIGHAVMVSFYCKNAIGNSTVLMAACLIVFSVFPATFPVLYFRHCHF